jgi:WD40 repeat protein
MMSSVVMRAFCWVAVAFIASDFVRAGELLEWKDVTGKFSVKAEFVELTDKELKLKREGGAELKIPLEKLSPESIAQAKKLASPDTAAPIPEVKPTNPYNVPKLLIPDWSNAVRIDIEKMRNENSSSEKSATVPWKFVYKSRIGAPTSKPAYSKILIPKYKSENEIIGSTQEAFLSANHASTGVVCESVEDYRHPVTAIHQLNLSNGKLQKSHLWRGYYLPIAFHAPSQLLLVKSKKNYGSDNIDVVEIWQLSDKGIIRKVMWDPYETSSEASGEITEAYFLDENRILLISERNCVSIWNINTGVVLCKLSQSGQNAVAVDLEQAVMAYGGSRRVYLISLTNYKIIGQLPEDISHSKLAFSPAGNQLAIVNSSNLEVWDLESQQKVIYTSSLSREYSGSRSKCLWLSDKRIMTGELLYDLDLKLDLCKYKELDDLYLQGDSCIVLQKNERFSTAPAKSITLHVQQLPHPAAIAAYDNFPSPPPAYYLVPGPDSKISIDVSGIEDDMVQEQALQAMTKQLTGYGYRIADDAVFKLVASSKYSETMTREYQRVGSSRTTRIDYRVHRTYLKLILGGKIIWETEFASGGDGHLLNDKEFEEFQKNAMHPKPNYALFLTPKLPEKFEKVVEKGFKPGTWKLIDAGFVLDKN